MPDEFAPWLDLWKLTPDGVPFWTHHAALLPVRAGREAAMLKLTANPDEERGARVMEAWKGRGAARVLARERGALLMERALGHRNLAEMARNGEDASATRILCTAAMRLHEAEATEDLVPLRDWFQELWPAAAKDRILARSAAEARRLLERPEPEIALHGDLHHGNLLDFESRGWLAIDPKGLRGDRAFDYANIFTNPDLDDPSRPLATRPEVFQSRLKIVSDTAQIDRAHLLRWIIAWTGLSAAWYLSDDDPMAEIDLTIARFAIAALDA